MNKFSLHAETGTFENESRFNKFQNQRIQHWNKVAQESDSWSGFGGYYHNRLQQIYKNLVPVGSRVLELGCGQGNLLASLMPSEGVGIDFSEEMLRRARKKYPHLHFKCNDVHELELSDQYFDFIIMSDLVNDTWDVQTVFDKLNSNCNSHTRLILNTYSRLWELPLSWVKFNQSPIPKALAIVSLPTLWVLFMSNLDGMVLVGLMILPLGIPLVMMKPQLSAFAMLAKKSSFIAAIIWGLISLVIWGLWPMNFLMVMTPEWRTNWVQDIALFPWGLIIALPLMWFSRGDEDLLMAAGSFATPHLFPYHFILLMPALGRMTLPWMILTWLISWTPLSANWIGPIGWHMGNVFGLCLWMGIYFSKRDLQSKNLADA